MGAGMRITDALRITYQDMKNLTQKPQLKRLYHTYTEQKTGKKRTVYIDRDWLSRAMLQHNPRSPWLFAGRDPQKHRTRQAVWKDLHRAAKLYRVNGQRLKARIGSHTARKIYAVDLYHKATKEGFLDPLEAVKADLNHSDPAVSYIYALADVISGRKRSLRTKKSS